jgi:hypothetical protein
VLLFLLLHYSGIGFPDLGKYLNDFSIHSLPYLLFGMTTLIIATFAVIKAWSFIPVLGLLTNFYLMSELGITNWSRFGIWLAIGLLLYFSYGIFHSKLPDSKVVQQ